MQLLWTFLVFLFIYAPIIDFGLGYFGDLLAFSCILILLFNLKTVLNYWSVLKPPFYVLITILLWSIFITLMGLDEGFHPQVMLRIIRSLIMYFGLSVFVLLYLKNSNKPSNSLIRDVYIAIAIHGFLMIIQFLYTPLREFIYQFTFADQVHPYNQNFRMAGLTLGGGSQLSLYQSFGFILLPFLLRDSLGYKKKFFYLILSVIIGISILLAGRTGVFFALFFFIASSFIAARFAIPRFVLIVLPILFFLISSLDIIIENFEQYFYEYDFAPYFRTALERSLELFLPDRVGPHAGLNELYGYYFLPDGLSYWLVGDPLLFDSSYQLSYRLYDSDVGYLNLLVGYGLFGLFLHVYFYLYLIYKSCTSRFSTDFSYITLFWAIAMLVINFKEQAFFSRIGFSFTVIFFIAMVYSGNRMNSRLLALDKQHRL